MSRRERRFLILHGAGNHRPREHWQHWLAEQLRRRQEVVLYPQLPDPDSPRLEAWLGLVRAELAQLGAGERIVVCHSLSVLVWLHHAHDPDRGLRVDRVLLVSPPSPEILWSEVARFAPPADLTPGCLRAAADRTRIIHSDNDPYCPQGADRLYAQPLRIQADRLLGGGHLSVDDGYGPWPGILDWCLHSTAPVHGGVEPRAAR
ncbi:MAG TPA: alpha/beta hydrolase [Solirubrobacteraceae bacterium]|nr:alpha/beta hydrolase [Solirubrobacteraceae bacterium]